MVKKTNHEGMKEHEENLMGLNALMVKKDIKEMDFLFYSYKAYLYLKIRGSYENKEY